MSPLSLYIEPVVHEARRELPGAVRQRLARLITSLADGPRPHRTRALDVSALNVPPKIEIRRFRLDRWRLVYAINEVEGWVWVLGLYRRPPYDYDDLEELLARLQG
jgi:mRNA interferase RelE/StbE